MGGGENEPAGEQTSGDTNKCETEEGGKDTHRRRKCPYSPRASTSIDSRHEYEREAGGIDGVAGVCGCGLRTVSRLVGDGKGMGRRGGRRRD